MLSLRSVVRGWRIVGAVALPTLVGVAAVLVRALSGGDDRTRGFGVFVGELLLPLVIGLVALVLGVNAFGDERDEQTLGLLLATALPRWQIVLAKYVTCAAAVWVLCLPATLGIVVLSSATTLPAGTVVWSLLLSTVLASAAYTALFVLLSLVVRRAVLLGLGYLLLWERLLADNTTAFRNLSIGRHAGTVGGAPWSDPPFSTSDASVLGAALVLVVVAVVAVAGASARLPRTYLR